MKSKLCGDKQCRRAGQRLRLNQFPFLASRADQRGTYCTECWNRQMREYREQRKLSGRPVRPQPRRKSNLVAKARDPFVKVYWAIVDGYKTREAIRSKTKLSYDTVGDVLVVLI